jgi:hypothetical protein
VITRSDLEEMTTHHLHERAVYQAKVDGDIEWLWHLLGSIPSAEAQLGDLDDSGLDVATLITTINGFIRADGSAEETLRPQYVDYLLEHL